MRCIRGRCWRVNLGCVDYRTIDPQEWTGREAEGILLVPHAIKVLYRVESLSCVKGRLTGFTLVLVGAFTALDAAIWMLS